MKYLSTATRPALTITRTTRRAIVDELLDQIVLTESTIKIEVSIPSIWNGIKAGLSRLARNLFAPRLAHYCACA